MWHSDQNFKHYSVEGGREGKNYFPCWSQLVKYGQENFILSLIWHVSLAKYECSSKQILFSSLAMPWQLCAPVVISIRDPAKDDKK